VATLRKQKITCWRDAAGRRVPPNTPGAAKVQSESRKWYAFGVPGSPRPIPLASNRRVAESMLARLISEGEAGAAGLAPSGPGKSLEQLIVDYRSHLLNRGAAVKYADAATSRLRRMVRDTGWRAPREITADGVSAWIMGLTDAGRPMSPQTRNHYRDTVRMFARWLAAAPRRLLPPGHLDGVARAALTELRRARRTLTVDELGRLLVATLDGPDVRGLTGRQRHLLYSVATSTGLRGGELASLTTAHLHLDGSPPVIQVAVRRDKARRAVRQPVPADVAAMLREYAATVPAGEPLWPGNWLGRAAEMLQVDLLAAGIPYAVDSPDGPLYADLHALRHTYISRLETAGVSLRQAMALARHSDPRLTMARYGRPHLEELGRVVDRLGGGAITPAESLLAWLLVVAGLPARLPTARTGTDNRG
jgi:integrase